MAAVVFYFQVHQPYRLRRYSVFDTDRHYFDDSANAELLRRIANQCYLPACKVLLDAIGAHDGAFRVAFSVTGVALEQFRLYAPDVVTAFVDLAETGCVDFLDETYYHSLASLCSPGEFRAQVEKHRALMKELFGQSPTVIRNTELIYDNDLGDLVAHMGYQAALTEGADHILGVRSPNFVYRSPGEGIKLLLKNYRLSDDISLRFTDRKWVHWPLTAEKFAGWVNQIDGRGDICNLFIDFETFGERHWADSGIFEFLRHVPEHLLAQGRNEFLTPAQAAARFAAVDTIDVPTTISWADTERDLSIWTGNAMQTNALHELYKLETPLKELGDPDLLADWRRLTSSDHFYYMCTKYWSNGSRHNKYFSPYESPYDSYINFMNVLDNVQSRLRDRTRIEERETLPSP